MNFGRISTNYAYVRSMSNIQNSFKTLTDLQEKMNTGKEINRPSDDPVGLQKVLALGQSVRENERYIDNIDLGINRLNSAASSLEQVEDIMIELKELLALQTSDATTSVERSAAVQQVDLLLDQLVNLANKAYQGKYVFGGTSTVSGSCALSRPYNAQYDIDGYMSGVVQNPQGIDTLVNTTILPGVNDSINISGSVPFQPNGADATGDIFKVVIDIRDQLRSGDLSGLEQSESLLDTAINQVAEQELILGTKINKLEHSKDTLEATIITEREAKSRVEDADLAALTIEYSIAETLFNTTLKTTATLLQNSLMNFI